MITPSAIDIPSFFVLPSLCELLGPKVLKLGILHLGLLFLSGFKHSITNLRVELILLSLQCLRHLLIHISVFLQIRLLLPLLEVLHLFHVVLSSRSILIPQLLPVEHLLCLLCFQGRKPVLFLDSFGPDLGLFLLPALLSLP